MKTQKYLRLGGLILFIALAAIALPFARAQAMSDVPCDTTALVNAIQNAVNAGGAQSLSLAANCTYALTAVNNGTDTQDANGLPVIANNVNLTIVGNGATIQRDANAPQFRILQIAEGSSLTISFVTLRGGKGVDGTTNHLPGWGGAIDNRGALNISFSNILENRAGNGGKANQGGAVGGGLVNYGTLIMTHSNVGQNVSGNGADAKAGATGGNGGGIYNEGDATITQSAIYGNKTGAGGDGKAENGERGGHGAGIMHFKGNLVLANSTVSGNKTGKGGKSDSNSGGAGGDGGGVYANKGKVTVINSTIAKNKTGAGGTGTRAGRDGEGEGIYALHTKPKLANTIVAENSPGQNCSGPGGIDNIANNLDTGTSCRFGSADGSQSNANPNLQKLANNGGFTLTHAIKKPSDAFNKGKPNVCAADPINNQDQRAVTRPQGKKCDIGAFELEVGESPTPTATATHTPTQPPSTATSTPTLTPSPTATQPAGACTGPSNGRVSCWKAENNANDSIGTNNGTLQNGVTFVAGKDGQAFHFNGSNQFVQIPHAADLNMERTNTFTIGSWIRTTETAHNMMLVTKQVNSGQYHGYGLLISNGESPACDASNPTAPGAGQLDVFLDAAVSSNCPPDHYIAVRGTSHLNDGQWHYVAMTYAGTSTAAGVKLYVDGVLESSLIQSDTLDSNSILNNVPFTIGSRENGGVPFSGELDEVQVWNRALTAQEIADVYNGN